MFTNLWSESYLPPYALQYMSICSFLAMSGLEICDMSWAHYFVPSHFYRVVEILCLFFELMNHTGCIHARTQRLSLLIDSEIDCHILMEWKWKLHHARRYVLFQHFSSFSIRFLWKSKRIKIYLWSGKLMSVGTRSYHDTRNE